MGNMEEEYVDFDGYRILLSYGRDTLEDFLVMQIRASARRSVRWNTQTERS